MAQRLAATGLGIADKQLRRFYGQPVPTRRVPMMEVPQTGQNLQRVATVLIEAFNDHRVELYDDADLRRDLTRMRVEERQYGFRLTSPRDDLGHGDLGSAFALAMLAASELAGRKRPIVVGAFDPLNPVSYDTLTTPMPKTAIQRIEARHAAEADAYQREMEELSRGGADPFGQYEWRQIMYRLGRYQPEPGEELFL